MSVNNLFVIVIFFFIVYFLLSLKEGMEPNMKTTSVKTQTKCEDCVIYNHRDAKSKCERACSVNYPNKNVSYTGVWTNIKDNKDNKNNKGNLCECEYTGQYKKHYVGCPTADSLKNGNDCFFWNDNEAKGKCQFVCNKFLPGKQSKWTGNWENTSAHTTSCECEYYD